MFCSVSNLAAIANKGLQNSIGNSHSNKSGLSINKSFEIFIVSSHNLLISLDTRLPQIK